MVGADYREKAAEKEKKALRDISNRQKHLMQNYFVKKDEGKDEIDIDVDEGYSKPYLFPYLR